MRHFAWLALLLGAGAFASDDYARSAKLDYMLYCQGCHTPDGVGGESVPRLRDHVGVFTGDHEGRAFLVRVPGSAQSILDDGELADVLNWIVREFGGTSVPGDFLPYSAEEVGRYRGDPLVEIEQYRAELLARLNAAHDEESP